MFVPADFPVYAHFTVPGPAVPEEIAAQVYRWGGFTVLSIFGAIWACDSAAYFAGRAFGRHKLFPRVSPNKTWEGAIVGFAAAVLAFVLCQRLLLPYLSMRDALVCGAIIGLFGQIGDLAESLLKRDAGVKDSSTLIPGHGGVLEGTRGREPRVHIITMGCAKNTVDSEKLMAQLRLNRIPLADDIADADIAVINTCGFINDAKEESIDMILGFIEQKKKTSAYKKVI